MKRKLWLLNFVLLALIVAAGWYLRVRWLEERAREKQIWSQQLKPAPPPPVSALVAPAPVQAASYIDVAQKLLFSKDRNPNVEVVVAPVKQMPPLPMAHGVFLFGDTPTVILSDKAGGAHKGYHPGQTIGEFKLLAVNNKEIEFEWDGKKVKRNLQDLLEEGAKSAPPPAPTAPVAAAPAAAAPAASTSLASKGGPGTDIGGTVRACTPGDTSPAGTVQDGMKKIVSESPFGKVCRWEPVK